MSFTEELLRKHADLYAEATVAAPFICKAAEGKLEKAELVGWLYQVSDIPARGR